MHLTGVMGLLVSTMALLLCSAHVGAAAAQQAAPPKDLTGKQWVLLKLDRETVDDTIRSTLTFAVDSRASGSTGCNRWFGAAVFDAAALRFTEVATTRMACPKLQMERETAFTRLLSLTRSWSLSGSELSISGEDGALLAVFRSSPQQGSKK